MDKHTKLPLSNYPPRQPKQSGNYRDLPKTLQTDANHSISSPTRLLTDEGVYNHQKAHHSFTPDNNHIYTNDVY